MKPNAKILLIDHDADLVTVNTFAALREKGYDVVLATSDPDKGRTTGLPCEKISAIKSKFTRRAICDIHKVIKRAGIDIVFCASTSALSNCLIANIGTGAKVIGYRGTQARIRRLDPTYYMALLNPRTDHIVCETKDIEENLTNYIPARKLSTHPKPYSTEWVAEAVEHPVRADISPDTLALSYVGISEGRPHKGLHVLVDAIKLLNSRGVKTHLTVVGKASQADIDRAPENISFTGNRPDAVNYIAGSDVFVLPSLRDASPRVVREAQACGIPCIVSDIPGARDLILTGPDERSGILTAPNDAEAIADAIDTLKNDPSLRKERSGSAIKNIIENYSFDKYVDYFCQVIEKLI